MGRWLRFLTFTRVMDAHDGVISLTDLGTWIVLIKIACTRQPALPDLAALLGMLLARAHKKHLGAKARASNEAVGQATEQASQAMQLVGTLLPRVEQLHERLNIVDNRTQPKFGATRG